MKLKSTVFDGDAASMMNNHTARAKRYKLLLAIAREVAKPVHKSSDLVKRDRLVKRFKRLDK